MRGYGSVPDLDTGRLLLRGPEPSDFPTYREFFADRDASAAYGGPLEAGAAWRVLATDIGHWVLRGYGRWTVIDKASGKMAGGCGLWWPEGWPRPELTWWIIPAFRRQGVALEASRAVIRFAYESLDWPMVETHMNDENLAAAGLVKRLGGLVIAREQFPDGLERNIYELPREPSHHGEKDRS